MKKLIPILFFILPLLGFSQDKVLTKTGTAIFEASVPSFEEVKATNKNSGCVLNTKTGEIVGLVFMKGFQFRLALMQEHFNENYMESDKYPKGVFKGKIDNFDFTQLTTQKQDVTISGNMELHGKSKEIRIAAKISKTGNTVFLTSNFDLNTDDFNIELPLLIRSKVAKKVNVTLEYKLQ
ncbi:YceI family protein [Flavobacterium amnicola]|uniref:YceI family protein n=1 Tax=Flavobacterium amnicola TaxID=2506422 RepID=A0A4Q1K3V5_9FLAO|nr:YceI family protein [Flavobacterium amnicola]RXR17723.1 YceI family protein [Flavobacterium amnicola]